MIGVLVRSQRRRLCYPSLQARSRRNHFTSIAIKLLAASHFLFAGLALGVVLPIAANIFRLSRLHRDPRPFRQEFGKACAVLCSADSSLILGQTLLIDGGAVNATL